LAGQAFLSAVPSPHRAPVPCKNRAAIPRPAQSCPLAIRDTVGSLQHRQPKEFDVSLTVDHITPLVSLLAGILILIAPTLLNYIIAIYLIVAGVVGLNAIHHFVS
jgi:hypothetical protein